MVLELGQLALDNHNDAPPEIIKSREGIFENFVFKTLNALIEEENTRLYPRKSSLEAFARLDIGLIEGANGKTNFFVNELERFPSVNFWRNDEYIGPAVASVAQYLWEQYRPNESI